MPARGGSSPTASTRTRRAESVTTVPATTRAPSPLGTGRDSPVIIDSSSSAAPSTTTPSAGTRPPGRTRTTSPTPRPAIETVRVPPPGTRATPWGSTDAQVGERDRRGPPAGDRVGLVGQQGGQGAKGAGGRAGGPHLQPVAQQHD